MVDTRTDAVARLAAGTTAAFDVPPAPTNQEGSAPLGVRIVNVIAIDAHDDGYLTVFGCESESEPVPAVSTMSYRAGDVLAHQTFVPVEAREQMCVFTLADTDVVIDTVGGLPATDHPTTATEG